MSFLDTLEKVVLFGMVIVLWTVAIMAVIGILFMVWILLW